MPIFDDITMAPPDPILGVTDAFKADIRQIKVNLGVGVYQDGEGNLAMLDVVRQAEQHIAEHLGPRPYLPIDGGSAYDESTAALVLDADHPAVLSGAAVTVQTLGGSGALKVGADFLSSLGLSRVLVSDPTWDNHLPILGGAGLQVGTYRYYVPPSGDGVPSIDFDGMLEDLTTAKAGTIVVLHACCHNPTGYDLTRQQWGQVIDVVEAGGLVPFVDMAYQGFAESIDDDAFAIREIARRGIPALCANSYSKTFGLYGERVGALTLITADAAQAARVRSQVKLKVRANYSNPPTHGQAIVSAVLGDEALKAQWVDEVAGMRQRIKSMRAALVGALESQGVTGMGFINDQRGMFSYMGLSRAQMVRLREQYGVFGVESGRLCVAGLNQGNVEYVAAAIAGLSA